MRTSGQILDIAILHTSMKFLYNMQLAIINTLRWPGPVYYMICFVSTGRGQGAVRQQAAAKGAVRQQRRLNQCVLTPSAFFLSSLLRIDAAIHAAGAAADMGIGADC